MLISPESVDFDISNEAELSLLTIFGLSISKKECPMPRQTDIRKNILTALEEKIFFNS